MPIVVISPVLRPDAEDEPNRLGATLADIRRAIESVTRDRIIDGDRTLALVAGEAIISADHLGDGIHPDDEGHKRIAATVSKALTLAMKTAKESSDPDTRKIRAKAGGAGANGAGAVGPGAAGDGDAEDDVRARDGAEADAEGRRRRGAEDDDVRDRGVAAASSTR